LLSTHPKVQEVAVVAAKSAKWGERPIAVVVPKQEYKEDLAEDELREYMMQYVGEGKILKWWIPEKFIFTEEIPRTSTGKFNKRALRSKYWDALDG
jgi:fatty-acyl-CoA synthase